jgi:hypothetical protein
VFFLLAAKNKIRQHSLSNAGHFHLDLLFYRFKEVPKDVSGNRSRKGLQWVWGFFYVWRQTSV